MVAPGSGDRFNTESQFFGLQNASDREAIAASGLSGVVEKQYSVDFRRGFGNIIQSEFVKAPTIGEELLGLVTAPIDTARAMGESAAAVQVGLDSSYSKETRDQAHADSALIVTTAAAVIVTHKAQSIAKNKLSGKKTTEPDNLNEGSSLTVDPLKQDLPTKAQDVQLLGYNPSQKYPVTRKGVIERETIPVQRGKNLGKWSTARPDANEIRAGQAFSDAGYNVKHLNRADDLGISGKKRADLHVEGIGRVDVWTPSNPNVNSTKKQAKQAGHPLVFCKQWKISRTPTRILQTTNYAK